MNSREIITEVYKLIEQLQKINPELEVFVQGFKTFDLKVSPDFKPQYYKYRSAYDEFEPVDYPTDIQGISLFGEVQE